jgi:hypothetical protein
VDGVFLYELMQGDESLFLTRGEGAAPGGFAVFDPCSSRAEPPVQESVRALAHRAGATLHPLENELENALCCSYGGHAAVANPEYTKEVIDSRLSQSDEAYLTYCSNCRDIFAREGRRSAHILDLVFGLCGAEREAPTLTERRRNRELLKKRLISDYGQNAMLADAPQARSENAAVGDSPERNAGAPQARGNNADAVSEHESFPLHIPEGLRREISDAYMLEEDIASVVKYCEDNGAKTEINGTGRFAGHLEIGHSTYWAEYGRRESGDGFDLTDAYSHRMSIEAFAPIEASSPAEASDSAEASAPAGAAGGDGTGDERICHNCGVPLVPQKTTFSYLKREFSADIPRCPKCGIVYISKDLAKGRMAEVESSMESK